jgi:membrane protein required for colicin V production
MIFKIVASFLTKFLKLIALGLLNKIIGAIFGVLKSLLILCVIIFVFSKINNAVNIIEKDKLQESFIFTEIERINKLTIEKTYTEKGSEE